MSARARKGTLLAALLLATVLPAPGLAVPRVKDSNGATVGTVRGTSNSVIRIFIATGGDLVPIRVELDQLVGPNIPHFKSDNCQGTPYVNAGSMDSGINRLFGRAYVTKGNGSRLYRTKRTASVKMVDIESRWDADQGGCVPWTPGPSSAPYFAANVFIRSLETDHPPPYELVGAP